MRTLVTLTLLCALTSAADSFAQQTPRRRPSPEGASATELGGRYDVQRGYVGGKWIEIKYGRPIKRGRDLFGPEDFVDFLNDGAPVWRAGANESTRIINEMPIDIGGTTIPPGTYTVFIELARDSWTLVVSTWKAQIGSYQVNHPEALFGAYEYTPDKDVVRTPMKVETLHFSFDQLHWEFLDVTNAGGRLAIFWDRKMASVPFRVVN